MTMFDECQRCGHKSSFMTTANIYECGNCGEIFCSSCKAHGRCPECGSEDFEKIGVASE
jgi:hypothetical protein